VSSEDGSMERVVELAEVATMADSGGSPGSREEHGAFFL
jgi:hypothetical protein